MWKRLNFANRTRENLAENPSPPPDDQFKSRPYEIPTLEFRGPDPAYSRHVKHPSETPTVAASSVYSEAFHHQGLWHNEAHGISPPDSPKIAANHLDDGRVSPVAEGPNVPRYPKAAGSKLGSYIPVARKPYAGGVGGNGGRLTPGNPYYIPTGVENIPPTSNIDATNRGVFPSNGPYPTSKAAKPREPWKGASGRTAMVDPVQDTPQAPRISLPPRHPDRSSPVETPTDDFRHIADFDFATPRISFRHGADTPERLEHEDTLAALTARRASDLHDRDFLDSRFSWSTHATGTTHRTTQSHEGVEPPSPPPPMPTNMPEALRKSMGTLLETPSSRQPAPQFPLPKEVSMLERSRPVPKDNVPTTPVVATSPGSHARSVAARKPVGGGGSGSGRGSGGSDGDAAPSAGLGITHNLSVKPAGDTTSIVSKSSGTTDPRHKDLPMAPSILSSAKGSPVDHVDVLRSRIDDLTLRRQNIQRAIHNLTRAQSENKNPMLTDWRTAREADARIKGLRDELADINREDHELGLKLHRAYKRREREGEMAGTSALWVRRVTS